MIRTLIIDDEPLARDELASLLNDHDDIEIVGEAANAIEGMAALHKLKPDLVFLDIQMPKITGMEMLAMLDPDALPKVVFVTAFDEHALSAFDNNAFDYLLKPVAPSRLAKTLQRVRQGELPRVDAGDTPLRHLPCYQRNVLKIIPVEQVRYVFSDVTGVHVATANAVHHTQLTLKVLEQRSPLLRCHRQYLVHPDAVASIAMHEGGGADLTTLDGQAIPVSRRHLRTLKQAFGFH